MPMNPKLKMAHMGNYMLCIFTTIQIIKVHLIFLEDDRAYDLPISFSYHIVLITWW